jgi:DNA-binding HxlR family transcriptional regulator
VRSYHQYCGLAKALDLVGDRWALLIVRELLLAGPSRYSDLQRGLPRIATNLLGDRLEALISSGVVARTEAPPPVAATLYTLTPWGEQLKPILLALGKWAGPVMRRGRARGDRFLSHWLALPLEASLRDRYPDRRPITIALRMGDRPLLVEAGAGEVRVRQGAVAAPDAVIEGTPEAVFALLLGRIDLATARERDLKFVGDPSILRRVQPRLPAAAKAMAR